MQIEITRKFQKQVVACTGLHIRSKVRYIIEAVVASENMNGFANLKKLTGYKSSYRIRLGDYRYHFPKTPH